MSGAIFDAIDSNARLRSLGVGEVYTDYSQETVRRDCLTVILRWGDQNYYRSVLTGPRNLDVWVHQPAEWGTDYTDINLCLAEVTATLEEMVQVSGEDNLVVTEAVKVGASRNINDPGFDTNTRYCSYRVLLREMV